MDSLTISLSEPMGGRSPTVQRQDIAQQCPRAPKTGATRSHAAERSSASRLEWNWRAQRGSLDAPSLSAAPYSRFERGGLYGCERQVRTCPRHAKARSFRTGRIGIMLAETPYHILLNLQERDCMADRHSSMAASSACRSISRRSRTSLRDGDLTASCLLPTSDRAKLGPVDVGS